MLQHVLIVLSGAIIAYSLFGRQMLKERRRGVLPALALLLAGVLIFFWHLPGPWDSAVINPGFHIIEHSSFLFVGLLAGSWILLLSDSAKIESLLAAFFGHMGYAVILISPWNVQVYSLYNLADQTLLGWVLLLTGPLLTVGIAYVVARNPAWLSGAYTSKPEQDSRRETFLNKIEIPKWIAPGLSVILIVLAVGYFTIAAYAVSSSGPAAAKGPVVFIAETPVSWQYSPQAITVVLGVNGTVTWVSHSYSYDTVTDIHGGFSSPPIAPGQSFSYTFTSPGTYQYFCQYHPWMKGTVKVLSAT